MIRSSTLSSCLAF